jgi:hypothetical protein
MGKTMSSPINSIFARLLPNLQTRYLQYACHASRYYKGFAQISAQPVKSFFPDEKRFQDNAEI